MTEITPTTTGAGACVDLAYYPDGRLVLMHFADGPESEAAFCGLSTRGTAYDGPNPPANPPVCPDCHKHVAETRARLEDAIHEASVTLFVGATGMAYEAPTAPTN